LQPAVRTTVLYTLSSFDPYDVAVFATTFSGG
jgi:hypothetical protein